MNSAPNTIIDGRYELSEQIGEGGMAKVWRGVMRGAAGFERTFAIKKMKYKFRGQDDYIAMFVEEARVASELNHPNIVQVFDFCRAEDMTYYMVMEWVEGLDLHSYGKLLKQSGQQSSWPLIVATGIGVLRGLSAAHERVRSDGTWAPVVHRDISPHNVLLSVSGVVKLSDFGLALAKDRVARMTAPGMVKGKLYYLAPEIAAGKRANKATDIFAVGITLWESLSGERLFDANGDVAIFRMIRDGNIRDLRQFRPDVPEEVIEVVHKALSVEPDDRYGSARKMANALAETLRLAPSDDYQSRLATSVRQARALTRRRHRRISESVDVSFSEQRPIPESDSAD